MGTAASSADEDGNNADTTPAINCNNATTDNKKGFLKRVDQSNNHITKDGLPLDFNEGNQNIPTVGFKISGESSLVAEVDKKCESIEETAIVRRTVEDNDNSSIIEKPPPPPSKERSNDEINASKQLSGETSVVAGDGTKHDNQMSDMKHSSIADAFDMSGGTSVIVSTPMTAQEKLENSETKIKLQTGLGIVEKGDSMSRASTDASTVSESIGEDCKQSATKLHIKDNNINTIPENVKVPDNSPPTNPRTTVTVGLPAAKNKQSNNESSSTKSAHTEEHNMKSKPLANTTSPHPDNATANIPSPIPMTEFPGLPSAPVAIDAVPKSTADNTDASNGTSDEPDHLNSKLTTGIKNQKSNKHSPEQQQTICATHNENDVICQTKEHHKTKTSDTTKKQTPRCDDIENIGIPNTHNGGAEEGPETKQLAAGKKVHSPTDDKGNLSSPYDAKGNDTVANRALRVSSEGDKGEETPSSDAEPEKKRADEGSVVNENGGISPSERKQMLNPYGVSNEDFPKHPPVNGERNVTGKSHDTTGLDKKQQGPINNVLKLNESIGEAGLDAVQRRPRRDPGRESDIAKSPAVDDEVCRRLSGTGQDPMEVDSRDNGGQKERGDLRNGQTPVANAAISDVVGVTLDVSTVSIRSVGKGIVAQSIDAIKSAKAKDPPSDCVDDATSSTLGQGAESSKAAKPTTASRVRAQAGNYDRTIVEADCNPETTDEPSLDMLGANETRQPPNSSRAKVLENNSSTLHESGAVQKNLTTAVNGGCGILNHTSNGPSKEPAENDDKIPLNMEETLKVGSERTQKLSADPNGSTDDLKAGGQQGIFDGTHQDEASVQSDKAEAAEEPPKSLKDIANRMKEATRRHHKLILMRLFTGSKDKVLKIAKTKEENYKGDETIQSGGRRTLPQLSATPSAGLAGLLPPALLAFRRRKQLDEAIAVSPQKDSYRSMALSGLNTWVQSKSAKRKRNKTLPFLFEYSECSIAAISSWATQPESDTSSQNELDSNGLKSTAACIDRLTCASTYRKCSLCENFGHYEVGCRERGVKPNRTAEIANEMKVNALSREMKSQSAGDQAGGIAVANRADHEAKKNKGDPNHEMSCRICQSGLNENQTLECDGCRSLYHVYCVNPPLKNWPRGEWLCNSCKQPISDASNYEVDVEACEGFLIEQRKRPRACEDRNERKLSPFRDWQMSISAVSASATHANSTTQSSVGRKRQRPCNDIDGISIIAASTSSTGETSTKNMRSAAANRSASSKRAATTSFGGLGDDHVDDAPKGNSLVPGAVVAWFDEGSSVKSNAVPFLGVVLGVNSYTEKILVRVIQQDCGKVLLGENEGSSTEDFGYEIIQNSSAGATIWHHAGDLHIVAPAAGQGSVNQFQDILPSRLKKKKRRSG